MDPGMKTVGFDMEVLCFKRKTSTMISFFKGDTATLIPVKVTSTNVQLYFLTEAKDQLAEENV